MGLGHWEQSCPLAVPEWMSICTLRFYNTAVFSRTELLAENLLSTLALFTLDDLIDRT